jgi:hypothetical protein
MRRILAAALVLACALALVARAVLRGPAPRHEPPPAATRTGPRGAAAAPAGGPLAEPTARAASAPASDEEARLRAALLAADADARSDADVLDAERLLAHMLLERPELAGAAADAFGQLRNRALAFRLARLLGRYLGDARVRAALVRTLGEGDPIPRELAAYAFRGARGDPEAAAALAGGFCAEDAPESLREAHAFALAPMLDDLAPEARDRARDLARSLVDLRRGGADLRAEAVDLLDARGADRPRALSLLEAEPDRAVALAAARALLRTGEPEAVVLRALGRFAAGDDAAARALRAALEEPR